MRSATFYFLGLLAATCLGAAGDTALTFFAFDDHAIPFKSNLQLTFETPRKHPGNPIVRTGSPGSPDSAGLAFYGSIIKVGAKYRMWYRAQSDGVTAAGNVVAGARLAYAESNDGARPEALTILS